MNTIENQTQYQRESNRARVYNFARGGSLWVPASARATSPILECSINRMGCGGYENIAGPAPVGGPLDPLTIAPGWDIWLSGDVGLTDPGSGFTMLWDDQAGTFDATMATHSAKPTIATSLLNGRTGIAFPNGGLRFLQFDTWDPPAPGTSPIFFWSIWRFNSWISGCNPYAGGSTSALRLFHNTTSNTIAAHNGTASANLTFSPSSWYRIEDYYSASASDYLKVGPTATPSATKGNTDVAITTFRLGSRNGGGLGSPHADCVCWGKRSTALTAPQQAAMDNWATSYYGASVLV